MVEKQIQYEKREKEPDWDTRVLLFRHGEYEIYYPKPGEDVSDRPSLGGLTEKGKKDTEKVAREQFEKLLSIEKPVDLVILHSPTLWLGKYRARAKETAEVTLEELRKVIDEKKLPEEKVRIISEPGMEEGILPVKELSEADIFYIYGAKEPMKYFQELRKKYGNEDWWEEYYNIAQELEQTRKEVGAESPKDIAQRFQTVLELIALYRKISHKRAHPDRKLVVWIVSHGEVLRPFIQFGIDAKEKAKKFIPKYNEGVEIDIFPDNQAKVVFKGEEYKKRLENYFND